VSAAGPNGKRVRKGHALADRGGPRLCGGLRCSEDCVSHRGHRRPGSRRQTAAGAGGGAGRARAFLSWPGPSRQGRGEAEGSAVNVAGVILDAGSALALLCFKIGLSFPDGRVEQNSSGHSPPTPRAPRSPGPLRPGDPRPRSPGPAQGIRANSPPKWSGLRLAWQEDHNRGVS
jgi:hypothetical protein